MADGGLGYNAPNAAAGFGSGLGFGFLFGSFPAACGVVSLPGFFPGFGPSCGQGSPGAKVTFARLSSSAETPKLLDPMEMEHRGQKRKARASYFGRASCDQNVGGNVNDINPALP